MHKSNRVPTRFPAGSKYVLEAQGPVVHRYVELPGGRRVGLAPRKAVPCVCADLQDIGIVPGLGAAVDAEPVRKKTTATARRRVRSLERA